MAFSRRTFVAGIGAVLSGAVLPRGAHAAFGGAEEQALYAAAKAEGELTWYTAHYDATLAEDYARAFAARYAGVKCNVVRTTAQVAYQRLTQELKAGGPQVDVLGSTDISHFLELKTRGLLEKFVPANAGTVIPAVQNIDADGTYHVTSLGVVGITLNTSKVKAEERPKSWPDLVDPKWKNQVSVGHPAFSGYVGVWCYEMQRLYGWEYFEKLNASKPQIGRSIQDTLTMLRSGERSLAAGATQTANEAKSKGEPIEVVYPSDGTIVVVSPSGIIKGAKHPNAAKLFMEFMLTEEASALSNARFQEPLHASITPKSGVALSSIKTLIAKPEALLKAIPDIKEKWRDTFGI